jgi:hypothetical protein
MIIGPATDYLRGGTDTLIRGPLKNQGYRVTFPILILYTTAPKLEVIMDAPILFYLYMVALLWITDA